MSLTPRTSTTPWGLRLTATPSTSPFSSKTSPSKVSKVSRNDAGLSLRHVIGTTANSANAIDTLPASNCLAFTAGAAAVIAAFDEDLSSTQRFYRARPTAIPLNPSPTVYEPSTPTNNPSDLRRRTVVSLRDANPGGSPFGTPIGSDANDSPGGKTWAARERVKAATCVSFSPDGKYLAIGETGYRPRVLVFSTSTEASPYTPLTSLADHTFGVKCVAFSPNSQYLASLGTANDGFLYIWSINNRNGSATLFASNKCTSNIFQIAWVGSNLVAVGTRHVKVWRIDSSTPSTPIKAVSSFFPSQAAVKSCHRILSGRNCLLGPLLEGTFTAIVTISNSKAIVCSESGDVCLLDDSEGNQQFTKALNVGFCVTAASLAPNNAILLAGKGGRLKSIEIDRLLSISDVEAADESIFRSESPSSDVPFIVAMAPFKDRTISIDTNRFIRLLQPALPNSDDPIGVALQLPAHGGSVLGVRPFPCNDSLPANFFTWSADGTILFWATDGTCKHSITVELEQLDITEDALNELKVVRLCSSANALVTGDKFGVLRFIDQKTGSCQSSLRAHAGEITDIAVFEQDGVFIASSGRDRTVQVFHQNAGTWDLLQTLDEHVGAVTGLLFTSDGRQLISCSMDRTVVVREALSKKESGQLMTAFVIVRTITLKATPISMALPPDRDDLLLVSAIDRNVHKYNLHNGHVSDSFKAGDSEGGDAVVLSSLAHVPTSNGQSMIAGVSSTDKSIRLYDENGLLLGRDWGHTEGVTDLTVITSKSEDKISDNSICLVTVAADGTAFIWSYGARSNSKHDISRSLELVGTTTPVKDLTVNKPPLRRVLSQSEMARFQQKLPDEEMTPTTKPSRPTLQKRTSRFPLAQTPRLEPSPMSSTYDPGGRKRNVKITSPSPPMSPRAQRGINRKPSLPLLSSARTRNITSKPPAEAIALSTSTEQICRSLRFYRKKLTNSTDNLPAETLRELERELGLTARAVGERAMKAKGAADETVMVKLLSQYSERLLEMLDEKFAATLAKGINSHASPGASPGGSANTTPERRNNSICELKIHETEE
ncbi:WD40 repeat-like protein [Tothia fuscella]|uniref:WD40 repeat-like protein n=1 Tax=Tothia fuscella TaxID=1048955 RepID=A0A9P4NUJ7_9PEZI|nr:WD40 repeat-like protein [Tothia fuscella]